MKKREEHESRFEPRKEPRIHHLNTGGKLDSPEPDIRDTIHHPNLGPEAEIPAGLKTPIIELEEPCCESHRIYGMLCANIALDYYNKKNDTKFYLVEDKPSKCSPVMSYCDILINCFFYAKEESDSSIKVFFAELKYVDDRGLNVTLCKVLERDYNLFDDDKDDFLNPDSPEYRPCSPNYDPDDFREDRRLRKARIAERSLNHYNNEMEAKYELVNEDKAMKSSPFSDTCGNWFHCSFHGVDRSIQKDNPRHDLFFAELRYNYPLEPVVYLCKKLTEGNNTTTTDCEYCHYYSKIEHPASGDGKYHREVEKDRRPHPNSNSSPCTSVAANPYDYWLNFGIYKDPRKEPGEHCSRALRIFEIVFAEIALHHYNTTHNSYFKLLEDASLESNPSSTCSSRIAIRCSFNARQRPYIQYLKHFFANLEYAYPSAGLTVTTCKVSKSYTPPKNDQEDDLNNFEYV